MSDPHDSARLVLLVLSVIAASVSGFVGGLKAGSSNMERAAVKAGHAYYATSPDGEPVFTWKEAKP